MFQICGSRELTIVQAQSSPNWLNLSEDLDSGFDDDIFSGLNSSNRRSRVMEQPSSIRQPPPALRMNSVSSFAVVENEGR